MVKKLRRVGRVDKKTVEKKGKPGRQVRVKKKTVTSAPEWTKEHLQTAKSLKALREEVSTLNGELSHTLVGRINYLNRGLLKLSDIKSSYILFDIFLAASYAYHQKDDPIISDGTFDELCKELYKLSKKRKADDYLKEYQGDFKAGTGYAITKEKYETYGAPNPITVYRAYRALYPN